MPFKDKTPSKRIEYRGKNLRVSRTSGVSATKTIAQQYGIKSLGVFENYLTTILFIRNICAHSDLLFDSQTPLGIKSTPIIKIDKYKRHSLYSSIKIICYFLEQISANRCKEITAKIDQLFSRFSDNKPLKEIIRNKIGYDL